MFLILVLFIVFLSLFMERKREGLDSSGNTYGQTNTEKDADKIIQNYGIIGNTIKGYSDMISTTHFITLSDASGNLDISGNRDASGNRDISRNYL